MIGLLENLQVFEDRMRLNIELTQGVIFAQRVMNKLIDEKSYPREKAYDLIQPLAMIAWTQHKDFKTILKNEAQIIKILSDDEIESCFSLDFYLKHVDALYQRVGL
jgi:adenylosuccinate lyase